MGHQVVGMEDYVAEGMRPLARCLTDVENCDAYVGIFGWRYGSIPTILENAAATLPANTFIGQTSVTEFELRHAIDKQKPVLVFLVDQNAEWPPNFVDAITGDGGGGKEIARLRQDLTQNHLVSYFRTPEDLASLVSASIYRTEMGRQLALESIDIEAGINQPWVRHNAPVNDSALSTIQDVIAGPKELQALQVDVGQGQEWWMTRLYFLSSLAADLTSIEVMIFLGENGSFIGVVHPDIVRERLLKANPNFQQYELRKDQPHPATTDLRSEVQRRADCWEQVFPWHMEGQNPVWVTKRDLLYWLHPHLIVEAIDWNPGSAAALQMQRLLDWPMRFVPIVENGKFQRVVDKQALMNQIARIFVREQVSRALSTTR
jgi:hypothetical protein